MRSLEEHIICESERTNHLKEEYPELLEQANGDLIKRIGLDPNNPKQGSRLVPEYMD